MVFLKDFFKEIDFEKNQQRTKNHEKFPMGRVKHQIIGNKRFFGYIPAFGGCGQIRCRPACTYAQSVCLFVCFVALHPKSTAMVMAGRSVHLITLFPGQA